MTRPAVAVDAVLAMGLSVGALVDVADLGLRSRPEALLVATLALGCTMSVAVRRPVPVAAAAVALGSAAAYQVLTHDPRFTFEPYAVLLTLYMVGRTELGIRRGRHRVLLIAAAAAFVVIVASSGGSVGFAVSAFIAFAFGPYLAGALVARRARDTGELQAQIALLLGEREVRERQAAADERLRLARELHDVAAHCLTEMVIQAGAARTVFPRDPAAAAAAVETVIESGQAAVTELTRLVDDSVARVDGWGSRLLDLAETSRHHQVEVEMVLPEGLVTIPAPVDLVAYRVVREALTNAARHSPGEPIALTVRVDSQDVDITVANEASSAATRALSRVPPSGGFGLIGMRERVTAFGGRFECGPTSDHGFFVRVRLPMTAVPPPGPGATQVSPRGWAWLGAATPAIWLALLVSEALTSRHRSGPLSLNVPVVAAMAAASALRRRAPIAFLVVVAGLALCLSAGLTSRDYATLTGLYSITVPVYAVASWAPRRGAVVALAGYVVVVAAAGLALGADLAGSVGPLLALGVAAGVGTVARSLRELQHQLETTGRALEEQTRRLEVLAARRERIAVAERQHAQVVRRVESMLALAHTAHAMRSGADPLPALSGIESQGRAAMGQMREILGTLRAAPTGEGGAPGSWLAQPAAPPTRKSVPA